MPFLRNHAHRIFVLAAALCVLGAAHATLAKPGRADALQDADRLTRRAGELLQSATPAPRPKTIFAGRFAAPWSVQEYRPLSVVNAQWAFDRPRAAEIRWVSKGVVPKNFKMPELLVAGIDHQIVTLRWDKITAAGLYILQRTPADKNEWKSIHTLMERETLFEDTAPDMWEKYEYRLVFTGPDGTVEGKIVPARPKPIYEFKIVGRAMDKITIEIVKYFPEHKAAFSCRLANLGPQSPVSKAKVNFRLDNQETVLLNFTTPFVLTDVTLKPLTATLKDNQGHEIQITEK